jgi:hypothetical protein
VFLIMAFTFEPMELNIKQAEKLLEQFNLNIDKHVTCIKNPEAGDCFFVFNAEEKQKGKNKK